MYDKVYGWAATYHGVGIRRDGILSQYAIDGSECLLAYGHAPAVFEYCDTYENTKRDVYWSTNLLWKSIMAGKPSYMQWDRAIFEENKDFCLRIGNKIGYHFVLQEAEIPTEFKPGVPFNLSLKWLNDGVAPVYEPCYVAMALMDSNDHVVARARLDESNPRSWLPDASKTEVLQVKFSSVPEGIHKFAVGLFHDKKDTSPVYKLGIQGRTANGWYVLR